MKSALIYLVFCLTFISCQRAEPEIYLIRTGFAGRINIIFNQDGKPVKYKNENSHDTVYMPKIGKPIKYEDGHRVYDVPASGILLTQFKENDGFIDRRYFFADSDNKRVPIKVFKYGYNKDGTIKWLVSDKSEIGIFNDGTSGSYGNRHIAFQEFIVSNYNTLDSFMLKSSQDNFDNKLSKIVGVNIGGQ